MEKMKITSKREYRRNRVRSGHAPHQLLKMAQDIALSKSKKESKSQ
ncbi:MAG: hypothetical protein ACXADC_10970 [Candidatus Thorarchaeota archaeon]|jgi:hypothetical protein